MFLHLCVILFTGGGGSASRGDLPLEGVGSAPREGGGSLYPEGGSASGGGGVCIGAGVCLQGGIFIQRGVCILGVGRHPNWILRHTSGRYASYWNAFLFLKIKYIISVQYKFKVQSISTNKCAKLTAVNTGTEVTDSGQVTPNSIGPFSRVTVGKKAL